MPIITTPDRLPFHRWAAQLIIDLPDFTVPLPPKNDSGWREWAKFLIILNPSIEAFIPIPTKDSYPHDKDWEVWAKYLCGMVADMNVESTT